MAGGAARRAAAWRACASGAEAERLRHARPAAGAPGNAPGRAGSARGAAAGGTAGAAPVGRPAWEQRGGEGVKPGV
jgi:hypothetical protein